VKLHMVILSLLAFLLGSPLYAQRPAERPSEPPPHPQSQPPHENSPRANQGRVPPAPQKHERQAKFEEEHREGGKVDRSPHVNNDRWYGHDDAGDKRYHVDRPFEHGHFEHAGPSFRYNVLRIDRENHRFWIPGGFFFSFASWDWPLCTDWCWDCGDDFVLYDDPDHIGWYLLYNIHTGVYVHVTYMGT
jgi:hypothetical protein